MTREGGRDRQTERETERETDRQKERQTDRKRDRQAERETDRQKERQTETDKQTEADKVVSIGFILLSNCSFSYNVSYSTQTNNDLCHYSYPLIRGIKKASLTL